MGNMGTIPAVGYESSVVQTFSSPTGTSHVMTYTASVSDMVLVINNVIQEPTVAYTTSGTTLTTGTLVSGDTMYIIYLALTRQTSAPGADTVTNAMIVDNAINSEHYTDGSIDLAHMSVNSIDSDQYVDGSIDLAHMSSQSVDEDNLHISNAGSNGQFLSKQSGDTGGLTWAAAGGAWSILTSGSASAVSSLTITGLTTKHTKIVMYGVTGSGGDYEITYSDDDGSTFESSNYYQKRVRHHIGNEAAMAATGQTKWSLSATTGSASDDSGTLEITVENPGTAAFDPFIMWDFRTNDASSTAPQHHVGWGGNTTVGDIDQILITVASGTFSCDYVVIELN